MKTGSSCLRLCEHNARQVIVLGSPSTLRRRNLPCCAEVRLCKGQRPSGARTCSTCGSCTSAVPPTPSCPSSFPPVPRRETPIQPPLRVRDMLRDLSSLASVPVSSYGLSKASALALHSSAPASRLHRRFAAPAPGPGEALKPQVQLPSGFACAARCNCPFRPPARPGHPCCPQWHAPSPLLASTQAPAAQTG